MRNLAHALRAFCSVRWLGAIVTTVAVAAVGGCGTYVPEQQEAYYSNQEKAVEAALALENAIVQSVHCELHNALIDTVGLNPVPSEFALKWAVQVQLMLTVTEKTTVAPSALLSFLPSLFTLLFGGSASSEATRVDIFNFYYPVEKLLNPPKCPENFAVRFEYPTPRRPGDPLPTQPGGSLLIRSDLKTKEWLFAVLANHVISGSIEPAENKNGMQHHITFVVDTQGNLTPGAKLAQVTLMPSGTFLNVDRKRTHDLVLTFGPADPKMKDDQVLAPNAQNLHLAAQFATALRGANVVTTP